jgi:hypothetical protein
MIKCIFQNSSVNHNISLAKANKKNPFFKITLSQKN